MVGTKPQSGATESRLPAWRRRFVSGLKAQPGKSTALGVLGVVLIVLLARLAGRGGPSAAKAAADLVAPPQNTSLDKGDGSAITAQQAAESEPVLLSLEPEGQRFEPPERDIFAVDYRYFPKRPGSDSDGTPEGVDSRQLNITVLGRRVGTFRLQNTITGPKPAAIIDGEMVRQGDVYKGFTVIKVNNQHLLLKHSGHLFRLNMESK